MANVLLLMELVYVHLVSLARTARRLVQLAVLERTVLKNVIVKMRLPVQPKQVNAFAHQDGKDNSVTGLAAMTHMVLNVVKNVFVKMEHLVTPRMGTVRVVLVSLESSVSTNVLLDFSDITVNRFVTVMKNTV